MVQKERHGFFVEVLHLKLFSILWSNISREYASKFPQILGGGFQTGSSRMKRGPGLLESNSCPLFIEHPSLFCALPFLNLIIPTCALWYLIHSSWRWILKAWNVGQANRRAVVVVGRTRLQKVMTSALKLESVRYDYEAQLSPFCLLKRVPSWSRNVAQSFSRVITTWFVIIKTRLPTGRIGWWTAPIPVPIDFITSSAQKSSFCIAPLR